MSTENPQPQTVTLEQIEASIASEHYFTALEGASHKQAINQAQSLGTPLQPQELGLLTICVLVLDNGFKVLGQSSCADPLRFDAAIGRDWARKDALAQCWPMFGYALKERMHVERVAAGDTEGGEA